jgi:Flp pilus assembly pilin Flp
MIQEQWRRRTTAPATEVTADHDGAERGASLVEYALLIGLIVLVAIVAMEAVGTNLVARFQEFASMFTG